MVKQAVRPKRFRVVEVCGRFFVERKGRYGSWERLGIRPFGGEKDWVPDLFWEETDRLPGFNSAAEAHEVMLQEAGHAEANMPILVTEV